VKKKKKMKQKKTNNNIMITKMELTPPPIVRRPYLDRNLGLQRELQQQKYRNGDLLKDMRKINDECTMMRGQILLAVHTNNIKYVKKNMRKQTGAEEVLFRA